jgi:predicted nucleic acid-binding Zn ribbon protein
MQKKTKRTSPVAIGQILPRVFQSCRGHSDQALLRVWDLWDATVGGAIAADAQPEAFKGKILIVKVSSSTWIHHLQFLKKDIIAKLNEALGQDLVEEIKFKIGTIGTTMRLR